LLLPFAGRDVDAWMDFGLAGMACIRAGLGVCAAG
jgi:hypothetical protein